MEVRRLRFARARRKNAEVQLKKATGEGSSCEYCALGVRGST